MHIYMDSRRQLHLTPLCSLSFCHLPIHPPFLTLSIPHVFIILFIFIYICFISLFLISYIS
ncbi:hypothetical protein Lalb_Chr22g0353271 [Lupinus albus]|uniref:Uncharacterized protein n=1 Tax=Lupinus albus TaxID=3870 RepID=A0A6A4NNV7_LUPAL|nr:hypothetical protein Lalb_Chr22g0353271 [Lupinus albus]